MWGVAAVCACSDARAEDGGSGRPLRASFSNTTRITIPAAGPADPYPSVIPVTGVPGVVGKVMVTLVNVSHPTPTHIDIRLTGPTGQAVLLQTDAGGSGSIFSVTYTFDQEAPGVIPEGASPIDGVGYRPSNYGAESPFPLGGSVTSLDAFVGTNPNGPWSLHVVDDEAPDGGVILDGWRLDIVEAEASIGANPTSIVVPAIAGESGPAVPYPSTITVAGLTGPIKNVRLRLLDFRHANPSAVDVLLVSPEGRKVMILSDVGPFNEVFGANLRFDQDAPTEVPEIIVSGTYRPTNRGSFPDPFPPPFPTGPVLETLDAFNGQDPNGTWSLHVAGDDSLVGLVGRFAGGWSLEIATEGVPVLHKGDFNGDGKPDLLWRHDISGQNVVWFMNGADLASGTFTNPDALADTRLEDGGHQRLQRRRPDGHPVAARRLRRRTWSGS